MHGCTFFNLQTLSKQLLDGNFNFALKNTDFICQHFFLLIIMHFASLSMKSRFANWQYVLYFSVKTDQPKHKFKNYMYHT